MDWQEAAKGSRAHILWHESPAPWGSGDRVIPDLPTTYTITYRIRPHRYPAWVLHCFDPNPPAHILLAWAHDTKHTTRKGGGALRRAWRRHGHREPVDLVEQGRWRAIEQLQDAMWADLVRP